MGFFSKIKDNFTGGGVNVIVDAPALFSDTIPVRVKIEASAPQTVNSIKAYLEKETFSDNDTSNIGRKEQLYEIQLSGPFTIQAGQSFVLEGTIATNITDQLNNVATSQGQEVPQVAQNIAGAIDKFSNFFDAMSNKRINYNVVAVADVEGIAFDPSDRIDIKKQAFGQMNIGARTPRF